MIYYIVVFLLMEILSSLALNNGLALTPPMGWMSWERFRCNIDCTLDNDNCISENLFLTMSEIISEEGYAEVGYEYVIIDDCWLESRRYNGRLKPDIKRFPSGIKSLSDFIHGKGLKIGIYEDIGNFTCAGYPGSFGFMEEDIIQFASWGIDYVKIDGCFASPAEMDELYQKFGGLLNRTGRPIVYSCSWPSYQVDEGMKPNYSLISENCNLWRNGVDIEDSWTSVQAIIDSFASTQDLIVPYAGPGKWNDPDMLIIGNFGLSYDQCKIQFALWAILAAPLIMSVDLRTIRPEFKEILLNKRIIDVDQDMLGIQGRRIFIRRGIEIWSRPISPMFQFYYSYAIAFVNRRTDGTPSEVSSSLQDIGLSSPTGYSLEDLYDGTHFGILHPNDKVNVKINPTGVVILKATVQPDRPYRKIDANYDKD